MLVVLERGKRRLNSHSCQQAMFSSFTVRQKLVHLGTTVPRVFLFILCLTKQEGGRSSMPVEVSCTEGGGSNWQGGGVAIEPSQRIFAVSTTPTVHVMLSQPSSMICSSPTLKKSAWIHLCACRMLPIIFRKKKSFSLSLRGHYRSTLLLTLAGCCHLQHDTQMHFLKLIFSLHDKTESQTEQSFGKWVEQS